METPVTFQSQGQQVVGMWHQPDDHSNPVPAVVYLHGFTGNKAEAHRLFVQTARALAARGVASLRLDFRGSGDSEGEFVDMTVLGEVADAQAALAWVRARSDVDADRVGVIGMSMGGLVAAYVLGDDPSIRAAALWNPVANPQDLAERRRTPDAPSQIEKRGYVDRNGWAVGLPFLKQLRDLQSGDRVIGGRAPVLIVYGDQDESVPNEEAFAYERALRAAGRTVRLHGVRGATHTFAPIPCKEEAINETVEWFVRHLHYTGR